MDIGRQNGWPSCALSNFAAHDDGEAGGFELDITEVKYVTEIHY